MKNKSVVAWVIIGILVFVILIGIIISNSKKQINWEEHYKGDSKDPYGEYLLQELIKDKYFLKNTIIQKPLFRVLPTSEDSLNRNYIFIGKSFNLNEKDEETFFTFIKNGNTAFIAANELPYSIRYVLRSGGIFIYDSTKTNNDTLTAPVPVPDDVVVDTTIYSDEETFTSDSMVINDLHDSSEEYSSDSTYINEEVIESHPVIYSDSTLLLTHTNTSKKIAIRYYSPMADTNVVYSFNSPKIKIWNNEVPYNWIGVSPSTDLDLNCGILSSFKTADDSLMYNMIGIPYGKGMLYVHTNPILFTNFYLKNKNGLAYTEHALSVLSNEKIYWDEFSKLPSGGSNIENRKEYLKYILSVESLKWAWYLLLSTTLLFLIFKSKRKQRIIPVIEQVTNTSIEYVNTTGRLYAQIGNHRKLIQLNMRLFVSMIQQKYGITLKPGDTESIQYISNKSGIEADRYSELFKDYKKLTLAGNIISTKDLHRFYINMQFIYQKINS